MKWLLIALIALIVSVSVALKALPDPGYVLLGYGNYSVESSLLVFAVVLLLAYIGVRLLVRVWRVPAQLDNWAQRRRDRRLQRWYDDATRALAEGRPERAERRLARLVRTPEAPLQAYLAAAQAASQRGDDRRRDRYLQLAIQRQPRSEAGILLQQAELQLAAAQSDQAQTTLARVQKLLPQNARLLRLQMQLYLQQRDWHSLRELLPDLRRSRVIDQTAWHKLAVQVYREEVMALSSAADLEGLSAGWKRLPAPIQTDQGLLAVYIEQMTRLGAHEQAGKLLRQQLKRVWDQRLVYLFGEVQETDPAAQQTQAENWLQTHPEDPVLLLSLGKLSLRNQLWGKARNYLEESVRRQPLAESYQVLAGLLEQLDEPDAAAECYRKGLALSHPADADVQTPAIGRDPDGAIAQPELLSRSA